MNQTSKPRAKCGANSRKRPRLNSNFPVPQNAGRLAAPRKAWVIRRHTVLCHLHPMPWTCHETAFRSLPNPPTRPEIRVAHASTKVTAHPQVGGRGLNRQATSRPWFTPFGETPPIRRAKAWGEARSWAGKGRAARQKRRPRVQPSGGRAHAALGPSEATRTQKRWPPERAALNAGSPVRGSPSGAGGPWRVLDRGGWSTGQRPPKAERWLRCPSRQKRHIRSSTVLRMSRTCVGDPCFHALAVTPHRRAHPGPIHQQSPWGVRLRAVVGLGPRLCEEVTGGPGRRPCAPMPVCDVGRIGQSTCAEAGRVPGEICIPAGPGWQTGPPHPRGCALSQQPRAVGRKAGRASLGSGSHEEWVPACT